MQSSLRSTRLRVLCEVDSFTCKRPCVTSERLNIILRFKFGILITSPQPASQAEKEEFKVVQGAYKKGGCVRKSLYDSFTVDNATGNIPLILNTGLPLLGSIIL